MTRRGAGRVGVGKSARERRIFQARGENWTLGDGLEVDSQGRLTVKLAPDSPLKIDRDGIREQTGALGEKNYPAMGPIAKLSTGAGTNEIVSKLNEIIAELIRTRRSRT